MIMAKGCRDTFEMTYDGILIQFSAFANYGHDKNRLGTWVPVMQLTMTNSDTFMPELSPAEQVSIISC